MRGLRAVSIIAGRVTGVVAMRDAGPAPYFARDGAVVIIGCFARGRAATIGGGR
jgi:hypothetical protein